MNAEEQTQIRELLELTGLNEKQVTTYSVCEACHELEIKREQEYGRPH